MENRHALPAHLVNYLAAVHAGEHDVEHDGVIVAREGRPEAGAAVVDRLRTIGRVGYDMDDGVCEVALVFDDQYVHEAFLPLGTTRPTRAVSRGLSYPPGLNFS